MSPQPTRFATEFGAINARYASIVLLRVISTPTSAALLRKHGPWLTQLIKSLQAAASRDEILAATLASAERVLQPFLFMHERGHVALANSAASLLHCGENEALLSFDADVYEQDVELTRDFSRKAIAAGGFKFAERLREALASHAATFSGCLRALRSAAVHMQVRAFAA